MPASVTVGVLLAVAALIVAKAAAWGLFQRKVMKQGEGRLARGAGALFASAALMAGIAVWILAARPF